MRNRLFQGGSLLLLLFIYMNVLTAKPLRMTPLPAQTLHITIHRSAADVYNYLSDPRNFAEWAPGFCLSIRPAAETDRWEIITPTGKATARFTDRNQYGIVDHYVAVSPQNEVYIPLRVIANQEGSEVIFTLFRLPEMTDEIYQRDMAAVQKDLQKLKAVLEK